ncbi:MULTISPECIES: BRO family protein [unclassified Streptomyces]|uniref:BRO family protein n=1 Tax=unclassified Streptomyces TaxID=2593676 RepID=UPI0033174E8F
MSMVARQAPSPFDAIRQVDSDGEHWSARDLQPLMGYARWNDFQRAIERAVSSAANTGHDVELLFRASPEKETGGRPRMNYKLSRMAAYLVAMNGDPNKSEVAEAQAYFAAMTRRAELHTTSAPAPEPLKITAAAGPLPYRDQAEILAILRPALPEPYATATAKVILARAMGERPELDPAETPLYAATFLAEKGHKAKTVAKFQGGFGLRVSNAYFKRHGRRPERIPGPAGSRIDTVAVYSAEDRPLLEEVYAGIADLIAAFEHGDQIAIGA